MEPTAATVPAVAAVSAAGGAGAPPPMEVDARADVAKGATERLQGSISYGLPNMGLFERLLKEGRLETNPLITYVGGFDKKLDKESKEDISIVFYTADEPKEVGKVLFYFKRNEPEGLYLKEIETTEDKTIRGKGYGKRILSALVDIARLVGMKTISLDSLPSAVSFYLQADPPFTFNNRRQEKRYWRRHETLLSEGKNNKTAKRSAGGVFEYLGATPMTAKLNRSRRANRKNRTRRRR